MNVDNCLVYERIMQIKENRTPYFVRELHTGYVVIGDQQRIKGYTLIYPRRSGDTPVPGPVYQLGQELTDPKYNPTKEELELLKTRLKEELDKLL